MNEVIVRAKVQVDTSDLDKAGRKASEMGGRGTPGSGPGAGAPPPTPRPRSEDPGPSLPPPPIPGTEGPGSRPPPPTASPPPIPGAPGAALPPGGAPPDAGGSRGLAHLLIQNATITIQNANVAMPGGGGGEGGSDATGVDRRPGQPPGQGGPGVGTRVSNFAQNTLSTATGIALGSSILGFLTSSAENYKENSKALADMGALFGDVGQGAQRGFTGLGSMSYLVRERTGILAAMGAQTNRINPEMALQAGAFARAYGLDPSGTAGGIGRASRLAGRPITNLDMLRLRGQAVSLGMSGGMMPEYMDTLAASLEGQFAQTGEARLDSAMSAMQTPAALFGEQSPLAQGQLGRSTMQQMGGMLSGKTSRAMKLFMLRSIGFGAKGGPGIFEAEKMLEEGVYNKDLLTSMFGRWRAMGRSTEDVKFLMMSEAKAAGMPLSVMEKMVEAGMSDEGFKRLSEVGGADQMGFFEGSALADMSPEQMEKFEQGGFKGLARRGIGAGRVRERQIESMMMNVGDQTLKSVMDLTESASNIGGAIDKIIKQMTGGDGFLDVMNKATDGVRTWTQRVEDSADAMGRVYGSDPSAFMPQDGEDVVRALKQMFITDPDTARMRADSLRSQFGMSPLGAK